MTNETDRSVNPKVRELAIGIRNFRTIQFYPLSINSQSKVADILKDILPKAKDLSDTEFGVEIVSAIKDNLGRVIGFSTGEPDGDAILDEMDNEQFIDAVEIIYSQNFSENIVKKARSLFEKISPMLQKASESERPRPSSAKSMDTPSTTSSKNTLKKEE